MIATSRDVETMFPGQWDGVTQARAAMWLASANGRARKVAPCLRDLDTAPEDSVDAARGIIVAAVLRMLDSATGESKTQTAGRFSVTTDTRPRAGQSVLTKGDIEALRALCSRTAKPVGSIQLGLP